MTRLSLLTFAVLIVGSTFSAPAQAAQWCAVLNLGDLSENCHFVSRQQCQASLTGSSDFCRPYGGRQSHRRETTGSGQGWR
jgi:hypothetical protein